MEQTGIKMVFMNRFHCCFSAQIAASAAPDNLHPQLEPPSKLAKAAMLQCRCSMFFVFRFFVLFFTPSSCKAAKAKEILVRFGVYGGVNVGSAFNHPSSNNG